MTDQPLLARFARLPRALRWSTVAAMTLLLLYGIAWLAVPPIVKSQAEQRLSTLLGREVRIGAVHFAPWSLELTVEHLRIGAAAGGNAAPQFSVERAHVNADLRSLLRLAPVIEAIDIDGPRGRLTRLADGRYDIDDVLEKFKRDPAKPASSDPARFALYNLRISGGSFEFDDRPVQRKHAIEALQMSLPFLSNLPDSVAVNAEPRLAFSLDGAKFDTGAQTRPFAEDRASQLELRIGDLDLAPWLPYLPAGLPLRPSRGLVSTQLQIQFAMPSGAAPRVSLKGQVTLRDVALVADDGASEPLLAWKQLQVGLADVQPLVRRIALGTVSLDGARFRLQRAADGRLVLPTTPNSPAAAADRPPASAASAASSPAANPNLDGLLSVEQIAVADAQVDWHDATTRPAAALRASALELSVQKLRWPFEAPAVLKLSGRLGPADHAAPAAFTVNAEGTDRAAKASMTLAPTDLRWLAPYLAQSLVPTLDGQIALSGDVDWARGEQPRMALAKLKLSAKDLRVSETSATPRKAGSMANAAFSMPAFALDDTSVDLLGHRAVLGSLKLDKPSLRLHRQRDGQWNLLAWLRPDTAPPSTGKPAAAGPAWQLQLGELQLTGGELRLLDEHPNDGPAATEPVRIAATGIGASVRGLAWPGAALARTRLQLRLAADAEGVAKAAVTSKADANVGLIEWNGQFATAPLQARGALRIERAPAHVFEPYLGSSLNLDLLRAEASWRGDVAVAQRSAGLEVSASGDALVGDLRINERLSPDAMRSTTRGDELLSWQSFALRGLQFVLKPGNKPTLDIKEAALTDFYSRLVITEQGRFNLRDVAAAPSPAVAASGAAVAAAPAAPAASAPAGASLPIDIRIGGTQLVNGKVDFTDRFVKPNYSAALTELNGRFGAFDSASRDMATLDLRGRAAGTALLEISGALNPTAQPLALDIRAKATDLELAPLSPYAGRYAGYAIERGKLSMEVAYKIDPDGKLDAKNQVILNQLTFGDKVDSPDATKLPVLLAVALLKDRNGVIDINLPVSGSINDPQFSVFGIVLKIIGNLLVKALTAPFALLAGGGSDDLSFVGFEAGTATLTDSGRAVIDKVAKALSDRPALKMTVTGASDPVSEREAAQRAALDARVRAEQRRDALRGGAAAEAPLPALDAVRREALVKRIYADTALPDKPRNVIGLAKELPLAEMEALLRKASPVTTDTARELALQRGLAVRDALVAKGLPSERLFLAAPKLRASGEDDAAWSPRVQLALSSN